MPIEAPSEPAAPVAPLPDRKKEGLERFEMQPVLRSALPDVASFLHQWRNHEATGSPVPQRLREDALSIERRLRWLLLENPVATEGSPLGYCLRDRMGIIRGLLLAFPAAFRSAEQRLLGLCSGSFFVEPAARSMGFYLFKKYLSSPGYSFLFATTCNSNSSKLWQKLGGSAIPNSETEYILPLNLDVMIPGFVATRTSSEVAAGIARIGGRCANSILRLLLRPSAELTIEPCRDWERLSELSRRHQPAEYIVSDRSPEFLKWRYGPASPLCRSSIYLFRDKQGHEGWFSLGRLIRGEQGQFRGSVLLDAIWPRERMSFQGIFQEILRLSAEADAIFLRSQPGLDYRECSRLIVPYKLAAPRVFAMAGKGKARLALDSLDYDDSDYGAWRFPWTAGGAGAILPQARSGAA